MDAAPYLSAFDDVSTAGRRVAVDTIATRPANCPPPETLEVCMTDRVPAADRAAWPRVVVVGAGFAGLNAAHALQQVNADVTVLDKNNYHTFQPLLYQVSTGYLAAEEVGATLRSIFRRHLNVTVRMGTAVAELDRPQTQPAGRARVGVRLPDSRRWRRDELLRLAGHGRP
jgi:NADPH-dependent 2,4-dienoyl-CoA reductase/sulfur reductase-like enzyme